MNKKLHGASGSKLLPSSVLALDVGATWLRAAYIGAGSIARIVRLPTPEGRKAPLALRELVSQLVMDCDTVDVVAVARAPAVDSAGRVTQWPSRPDWIGISIKHSLQTLLPRARIIDMDDGEAAAAWEHLDHGAGRQDTTVTLSVGTGLAVGVVRAGKIVKTGNGADTLGHLPLADLSIRCRCGLYGCIQTLFCPDIGSIPSRVMILNGIRQLACHLSRKGAVSFVVITGGRAAKLRHELGNEPIENDIDCPKILFARRPSDSALYGAALIAVDGWKIGTGGVWIRALLEQRNNNCHAGSFCATLDSSLSAAKRAAGWKDPVQSIAGYSKKEERIP